MKITALIFFSVFLLLAVVYQPAPVFSEDNNFNADGLVVDKAQYEALAAEREKSVGVTLENGYTADVGAWKDPIKLRKKRMEQWEQMRAQYPPESLPHKIEK